MALRLFYLSVEYKNITNIVFKVLLQQYIMQLTGALLSRNSKNKKNTRRKKKSLYFRKWNFLALRLISYIFSEESFSYISRNGTLYFSRNPAQTRQINKNPPRENFFHSNIKNFLHALKRKLSILPETETHKNSLYFRKRNFLIFRETSYISATGSNFPSSKRKKNPLTQISRNGTFWPQAQGFSSLFFQVFSFFITDFYHCFSGFFTVDCIFSCHQFCSFFVRYFAFVLLYRTCYGFKRTFLLSSVFYLTLLPHICHSTASASDFRELFILSGVFHLTLLPYIWYKLLGAESSSLKVAGPPNEV